MGVHISPRIQQQLDNRTIIVAAEHCTKQCSIKLLLGESMRSEHGLGPQGVSFHYGYGKRLRVTGSTPDHMLFRQPCAGQKLNGANDMVTLKKHKFPLVERCG